MDVNSTEEAIVCTMKYFSRDSFSSLGFLNVILAKDIVLNSRAIHSKTHDLVSAHARYEVNTMARARGPKYISTR
jgi:hypothetical protein